LGDGLLADSPVPVAVVDIQNATEIAVGDVHTCARHAGGVSVSCWGQNTLGQLGDGTEVGEPRPGRVVGF
jgi:alpha-tubulin suppressor-like RCC1 family protein